MSKKLTKTAIKARLDAIPGWSFRNNTLVRKYTFATFPDAIAFVTRLGFAAEAKDHHPDLHIDYKRVTVGWSTHSEGGVTEKDFAGARQSDMIAATHAPQDQL